MNWTLKFLPEAQKDFEQLAGNQKLLVAKALDKVVQNPVSIYEGGYRLSLEEEKLLSAVIRCGFGNT